MSEKLNNNPENNLNANSDDRYNALSEMSGSFDPGKAEAARKRALEAQHVLDGTKHRKEEYLNSDLGQQEKSIEETYDSWYNDIEEMVRNGQMTEEQANEMLNTMTDSAIEGIDTVRQEYVNQQELVGHEEVQKKLEAAENGTAKEYSGETNINGNTGKERTFSEWDIHPKMKGETSKEFGDREKKRGDMAILAEHVPMYQDESPEEYSQRINQLHGDYPRKEGESLEQYNERIDTLNQNNELLLSEASHIIPDNTVIAQRISDEMNNISDMQKSGRFDEMRAKQFQREVLQRAIEDQRKLNQDKAKEEKRAQLKEKLQQKHESESNVSAEQQPTENETTPIDEQANQNTITPQGQQAPQEQIQQQSSQEEIQQALPNTKKKIGLFGRIKGFFSKRRQAKAERLERAQAEERAKQAQLAEEAKQQRIAEYIKNHPNAERDVERAEAMAYAGDDSRTRAVTYQRISNQLSSMPNVARNLRKHSKDRNAFADYLEEEAGRQYDREQNPDQAMKEAIVDFSNNENEYLSSPKQDDGDFNNEKAA